jgi:hypothetical protein
VLDEPSMQVVDAAELILELGLPNLNHERGRIRV